MKLVNKGDYSLSHSLELNFYLCNNQKRQITLFGQPLLLSIHKIPIKLSISKICLHPVEVDRFTCLLAGQSTGRGRIVWYRRFNDR